MENVKPKAVTYVRVSTDDQAETGSSLDVQEELCSNKLQSEGYEIVAKIRDEGKSGKNFKRPGIMRVQKLAQDGEIKAVCALSSDRISRNTLDYLLFLELLAQQDVEVLYIHQQKQDSSASSKVAGTLISALHQFQVDSTSEKVKATQDAKLNLGILPSMPPVGYVNAPNKEFTCRLDEKIIAVDDIKGPLMTEAFRLYATGDYNAYQLCDLMYKKGLTNRKGNQISYSRFYALLRNRFYLGEIHWKGRVVKDARHEALIDESTFNAVQHTLDSQNHHASRQRKHKFLLRGFLRCPEHNRRVTAEWHLNKRKAYYHCPNRTGCGRYAEITQLEEKIEEKFKDLEFNPTFVRKVIKEAQSTYFDRKKSYRSKRQGVINKRTAIVAELETAEDKLVAKVLDDETYVRIRDKNREELERLDEQLFELDSQHGVEVDVAREIFSFTENIYRTYKKADFRGKRSMLSFFWESFDLVDGVITKSTPTLLFRELQRAEQVFVKEQNKEKTPKNGEFSSVIITDIGLSWRDAFRTFDWQKAIPDPEGVIADVKELMSLVEA